MNARRIGGSHLFLCQIINRLAAIFFSCQGSAARLPSAQLPLHGDFRQHGDADPGFYRLLDRLDRIETPHLRQVDFPFGEDPIQHLYVTAVVRRNDQRFRLEPRQVDPAVLHNRMPGMGDERERNGA